MADLLKNPIFLDETKAREWLEARVWAERLGLPRIAATPIRTRSPNLRAKPTVPGVCQCNEPECRQQFTVTVNTVFERSKIPLTKLACGAIPDDCQQERR